MKILLGALALALIAPLSTAVPLCAAEVCCKRCKAGKPCGDSCIAKDRACSKPKGCACQG